MKTNTKISQLEYFELTIYYFALVRVHNRQSRICDAVDEIRSKHESAKYEIQEAAGRSAASFRTLGFRASDLFRVSDFVLRI